MTKMLSMLRNRIINRKAIKLTNICLFDVINFFDVISINDELLFIVFFSYNIKRCSIKYDKLMKLLKNVI